MKNKLLLLAFFFLFTISISYQSKAQVNERDSLALVDLYHTTGDGFRYDLGWLKGPVSTWRGVTLSNNRVVELNLVRQIKHGTLSDSLGNMDSLRVIYISGADSGFGLTGNIPPSIGKLHRLYTLDLSSNTLTGCIPYSIGNLDSLHYVGLYSNNLSGTLPSSIGKLKDLLYLILSDNELSGTLPSSVGQLTNLINLRLENNQFSGSIPASFKKLTNITSLSLAKNHLNGQIGNVFPPNVNDLDLSYNNFDGDLPSSLRYMANLFNCNLSHNQFSGHIIDAIAKTKIVNLDLSFNALTGKIPGELGDSGRLFTINLSNNHLTGTIPASFSEHVAYFDASFNNLSGDLSAFFNNNLTSLISLRINNNHLFCSTNPQWTNSPTNDPGSVTISAQNNHFTFNGLEFLAEKFKLASGLNYSFDPQAVLPVHKFNNGLAVSAGGTLSHNIYTWHKIGSSRTLTIGKDSTFQPPSNGKYYATITNAIVPHVTLMTDTITYTKSALQSPVETGQLQITASPNPARYLLQIDGLNSKGNEKILIADMTGNIWVSVMSRQQSIIKLDVSRLKVGNYLIHVNDEKGTVKTLQFLKE